MKANLPRFLHESLPVEYREGSEERDRLAGELARLEGHLAWLRNVARAAGVSLEPAPAVESD